jgi:hypothetical protein
LLTRPCGRCIEQPGDTDSARQPTIDSGLDEAWREEANDIVMLTWRLLQASRAAMLSTVAVPVSISDSHCRPRVIAVASFRRGSRG